MDEQPKRYRQVLAWLLLPPAVVLMVPVIVFLAIAFYVRAAALGFALFVRVALMHKANPASATQPPHLLKVSIGARAKSEG